MKFLLSFVLIFSFWIGGLAAQSFTVAIRAKSAIVFNPDNGAILFQKEEKTPQYPASITKIATALYLLETLEGRLEEEVEASEHALKVINAQIRQDAPLDYPPYILEHDGVVLPLEAGEKYTYLTLIHGLLLRSANDAANVAAEGCSGSITDFMSELNAYLEKKGISQTHFVNPHGLYHPVHMTTALDMAKIAGWAFEHPLFCEIIESPMFPWQARRGGERLIMENTNRLIREGKYHYPKVVWGKIGYTRSSGYNLVAAAEDNGRRLVVVLMGCPTSVQRYEDAIALFEIAFRERPERRRLFSRDHAIFSREMRSAVKPIKAHLRSDVEIEYFPSEERPLKASIIWHKIPLPILAGAEVGQLLVTDEGGRTVSSAPLYATSEVKGTFVSHLLRFSSALRVPLFLAMAGLFLLFAFLQSTKKGRKLF